jgi:hypothetical protein
MFGEMKFLFKPVTAAFIAFSFVAVSLCYWTGCLQNTQLMKWVWLSFGIYALIQAYLGLARAAGGAEKKDCIVVTRRE